MNTRIKELNEELRADIIELEAYISDGFEEPWMVEKLLHLKDELEYLQYIQKNIDNKEKQIPLPTKDRSSFNDKHEIHNRKCEKLHRIKWCFSTRARKNGHWKRWYLSGARKYASKESRRLIRRSADVPDNGGFKKVYDYWWDIF